MNDYKEYNDVDLQSYLLSTTYLSVYLRSTSILDLKHVSIGKIYISTPTDNEDGITKWKDQFNKEIMKFKNDSSNNPLFTSDRYGQIIISVTEATQKCHADRTKKEKTLLKTYDVVNFVDRLKLGRKKDVTTESLTECYVSFKELFNVIYENHVTIGHRGILNTMKELKKRYMNVTEKQVTLFISGCDMAVMNVNENDQSPKTRQN